MNDLTVKQFAKKHKVSPDAVETWIRRKRIKAHRFGRQWAIPADQKKPLDRRFSGNK